MKLIPYKDIIKLTKDAARDLLAGPRANEMRKRAELEIAKIESDLVTKQQEVQEIGSEYPIDFDKLIKRIDDLALLERRKKQFGKIIEEMFP